jgi:WD40 repeat protein/tRNA A-37 threonylcarbamoyl transferase component Bud32
VLAPAPFCSACLLAYGVSSLLPSVAGSAQQYLAPGTTVGRYEVTELLGEGGFAEVYSARVCDRDASTAQHVSVALKVIKRGMDSREVLARFRAEHRAIEALSHPNIVHLLEVGLTSQGLPYFAMPQVEGLPVTEYCAAAQLTIKGRLGIFREFCGAVQHAHQKGLLHRDIKPSNILVEETADGPVPKVIDFGIAKALDSAGSGHTLVTQLGQVLGTPTYMSPEQAAGDDDADTRSDIYSLGAVLYEMLTGCPPFDAETLRRLPSREWAGYLRENGPALPSQRLLAAGGDPAHAKQLQGDLDKIVRKAMALAPDRRYASAAAFAEDVQRWLENRPVSARRPSVAYAMQQYARRHRWPVAVGVSILCGIIATAGVGAILAVRARRAEAAAVSEKDRALLAEKQASEAREQSEHRDYQSSIALAKLYLDQKEPYLAAEALRATQPRSRAWEWAYLMASIPKAEASAESGHAQPGVLAANSDGSVAAVAEGNILHVLNVSENRVLSRQVHGKSISRIAVSDDGLRVATIESSPDGDELHVSRADGAELWSSAVGANAEVAWEPAATGGALLIVSGNSAAPSPGRLARLDPGSGRVLNERTVVRFKVGAQALVIGRAGKMAAVSNSYKDLEIVALPGLETLSNDDVPSGVGVEALLLDDVRDEVVIARGGTVYAGPASHGARVHVGTLSEIQTSTGPTPDWPAPPPQIRYMNWLPDGRWMCWGESTMLRQDGSVEPMPSSAATRLVPLAGSRVLVLLDSGRVEIRPLLPPSAASLARMALAGDYSEGRGAVFSTDSQGVFFQSWRRDTLEYMPLQPFVPARRSSPAATFGQQADGEWCVLPSRHPDGSVLVRTGGQLLAVQQAGEESAQRVVANAEGAWSADASGDGTLVAVGVPGGVRVLDWKTGNIVREWALPGGPFHVAMLKIATRSASPFVVALGSDATLHYLPLAGAVASYPLPLRINGYYPGAAAFHHDRALLAGALAGGGFAVYDLSELATAGPRLLQRTGFVPVVTALAFTPDTRRLAVASDDHRLAIWDWPQRLSLLEFPLNSTCASIAFSADGEWMANTDYEPSLVLRHARSGE